MEWFVWEDFGGFFLLFWGLLNVIFTGFFPYHLQSNRHEDHCLLMPLNHDPDLLVLPIHKKFPAGWESHPEHDAIAAFVHLSSI